MEAKRVKNQPTPQSHPWLLIHHYKDENVVMFYSISDKKYYTRIIPEMEDKQICSSSSCGWLILRNRTSNEYQLFNPIKLENIQLPPLSINDFKVCFLTSAPSPTDQSACHVLFVARKSDGDGCVIFFCKPGDAEFIKQEFDNCNIYSLAVLQGTLYCLGYDDSLRTINFTDSHIQLTSLSIRIPSSLDHPYSMAHSQFLIECDGELYLIYQMYYGLSFETHDFEILRLDQSKQKWMRVDDIENSTIFLSYQNCTGMGMKCDSGVKQNSIYFLPQNERCFRIFNVKNRRFSMVLPYHKATLDCTLAWI